MIVWKLWHYNTFHIVNFTFYFLPSVFVRIHYWSMSLNCCIFSFEILRKQNQNKLLETQCSRDKGFHRYIPSSVALNCFSSFSCSKHNCMFRLKPRINHKSLLNNDICYLIRSMNPTKGTLYMNMTHGDSLFVTLSPPELFSTRALK